MFIPRLFSNKAFRFSAVISAILLMAAALAVAQTTISTGSIVGTVTDPQGAVVTGAKVTPSPVPPLGRRLR